MITYTGSTFGDILRSYRENTGLSMRKFAEATGTNVMSLSSAERGTRSPPPTSVALWADYLKLEGNERQDFISAATSVRISAKKAVPELEEIERTAWRHKTMLLTLVDGMDLPTRSKQLLRVLASRDIPKVQEDALVKEVLEILAGRGGPEPAKR